LVTAAHCTVMKNKILNLGLFEVSKWLAISIFSYLAIWPVGPNGKIDLYSLVHVHKEYKSRVGDRQLGFVDSV
jgi:hypothetical protein